MKHLITKKKQVGMIALLSSILILMAITIIVIYATNSVVMEQRISSNAFRGHQAETYAQGGMDFIASFVNKNGVLPADLSEYQKDMATKNSDDVVVNLSDNHNNPVFTDSQAVREALWEQSYTVRITDGSDCSVDPTDSTALICGSERTITQSYSGIPLASDGMNQSLVNGSSLTLQANMTIINRYTHINIWSADSTGQTSSAPQTYILGPDVDTSNYTLDDYIDPTPKLADLPGGDLVEATNATIGFGVDVVGQDMSLASLDKDDFFINFMNAEKDDVKELAKSNNQYFANFDDLNDKIEDTSTLSGLVWVGSGSALSLTGTYGSKEHPIMLVVHVSDPDANDDHQNSLTITGTLYGLLYVIGNADASGGPLVTGALIVEGKANLAGGTLTIVYSPSLAAGGSPLIGKLARVSGSWKDF